jgi:hypothetical protein
LIFARSMIAANFLRFISSPARSICYDAGRTNGARMHILTVVVFGLVALGVFFFGARLLNRSGQTGAVAFIGVWLIASLLNGAVGVMRAGIPLINELGAFIPIFGIPAAAAWYLATRQR